MRTGPKRLHRLGCQSVPTEAMAPGRKAFPVAPKPASLPHCPASAPDFFPFDVMRSVFLVLPLILFFKG